MAIYEPPKLYQEFSSVSDSLTVNDEIRKRISENKCTTGITFLDQALGGIGTGDLVLLSAPTGAGKSELAINIAMTNAKNKKRVHLFALEAEQNEVTNRLLYKIVSHLFYTQPNRMGPNYHLNYIDWLEMKFNVFPFMVEIEKKAVETMKVDYENLFIYYRDDKFDLTELKRQIGSIKDQTDLIILDHFHYIDTDDVNENKAATELIKEIRNISLYHQKPIILVAHLRKKDSRYAKVLPDLDDIHGSSNLVKIATKAVVIAPCYTEKRGEGIFSTFVQVAKNRRDGSRCRYVALVDFDYKNYAYLPNYQLGVIEKAEFKKLESIEWPKWAKVQNGNPNF